MTSNLTRDFRPNCWITWVSSGYTNRTHYHRLNNCWLLLVVHHLRLLGLLIHRLLWCIHLLLLLRHVNWLLLGLVLRHLLVHRGVNGRAAAMIGWHHKHNFIVSHSTLFEVLIELESVQTVAVVEPELWRAKHYIQIVFVIEGLNGAKCNQRKKPQQHLN